MRQLTLPKHFIKIRQQLFELYRQTIYGIPKWFSIFNRRRPGEFH